MRLDPSLRYCLGPLARHSLAFKRQYLHARRTDVIDRPRIVAQALLDDLELHEKVELSGVGSFRAYRGGIIHVRFKDRVLLKMQAGSDLCELLLPDATKVLLPLGRGSEAHEKAYREKYVSLAIQFARWVFLSPDERERVAWHNQVLASRSRMEINKARVYLQTRRIASGAKPSGLEDLGDSPTKHLLLGGEPSRAGRFTDCYNTPPPLSGRQDLKDVLQRLYAKNQEQLTEVKTLLRQRAVLEKTFI